MYIMGCIHVHVHVCRAVTCNCLIVGCAVHVAGGPKCMYISSFTGGANQMSRNKGQFCRSTCTCSTCTHFACMSIVVCHTCNKQRLEFYYIIVFFIYLFIYL